METSVQDAPPTLAPTTERVLAALLFDAQERHTVERPKPVTLKLSVDQASLLYRKLCKALGNRTQEIPAPLLPGRLIADPYWLLAVLENRLRELPSTTPASEPRRGYLKLSRRFFTLEILPHERAYLRRVTYNDQCDQWRNEGDERELFCAFKVVQIAEETGGRAPFFDPFHPENPEALLRQPVIRNALDDLPKKLRMPAQDIAELLIALFRTQGNVSEAARETGQPQRKTARRAARIQKHFQRLGLTV
jgi:DNA-directed RNA polymerase specialized sigma24 family protein